MYLQQREKNIDVVNLFTNIPLHESIDIALNYAYNFGSANNLNYTRGDLKKLLILATSGMFDFNGSIFKQIDGVAMGNPLAPLLAEFFMCHFENNILASNRECNPVKYFRYVDDILCTFSDESHITQFLDIINNTHPNIKFTVEHSVDNSLPYLDVLITLDGDKFCTTVFRKPTNTGILLNFKSVVPRIWKIGMIKCLLYRAFRLCSSWGLFHLECEKIKNLLTFNNYPYWWFENILSDFLSNYFSNEVPNATTVPDNLVIMKLPYVGKASDDLRRKMKRIFRQFRLTNIKIVFNMRKLHTVFNIKSQTPTLLQSSLVYRFTCSEDPNIAYIGQTERQLYRRLVEHKTNNSSAIKLHVDNCLACRSHDISERFKIIHSAKTPFELIIAEALLIKQHNPFLNTQQVVGRQSYMLQLF